jgi:hypothetical protein
MNAGDEEAANAALLEHHRRAVNGEAGGPVGAPAERIKRVLVYKKHPDDFNSEQTMSADVAAKEVAALAKDMADENGVLNTQRLAMAVSGLSHPMVESRSSFDSQFKMKEDSELDLSFLKAVE